MIPGKTRKTCIPFTSEPQATPGSAGNPAGRYVCSSCRGRLATSTTTTPPPRSTARAKTKTTPCRYSCCHACKHRFVETAVVRADTGGHRQQEHRHGTHGRCDKRGTKVKGKVTRDGISLQFSRRDLRKLPSLFGSRQVAPRTLFTLFV